MNIYLSHSSAYDYQNELYAPLKTSLGQYPIFFPHDQDARGVKSKDIIASSDVLLAEVSYPSTGQGIEIGWADILDIPIICFHRSDATPTSSLKFISSDIITYDNPEDMVAKLKAILQSRFAHNT